MSGGTFKIPSRMIADIDAVTGHTFSLEFFGAQPGVDARQAFQDAVDHSGLHVLDLGGKTWKVVSNTATNSAIQIARGNIIIQNGRIDASEIEVRDLFRVAGSEDAPVDLTADATSLSTTLNVASGAGFQPDDVIRIRDDKSSSRASSDNLGEIAQVVRVDGNTLHLFSGIAFNYHMADNARVNKINHRRNVWFRNLDLVAPEYDPVNLPGLQHRAINSTHLRDSGLVAVKAIGWAGRMIAMPTAFHCLVDACHYRGPFTQPDQSESVVGRGVGLGDGSYDVTVRDSRFEYCRHGVAAGGEGALSRFCRVHRCFVEGALDAGLDAHDNTDSFDYSFNVIRNQIYGGQSADGILMQGSNSHMQGNFLEGRFRHGLYAQVGQKIDTLAERGGVTMIGNTLKANPTSGATGMFSVVANGNAQGQTIEGIRIVGNKGARMVTSGDQWGFGVRIAAAEAHIRGVQIGDNDITGAVTPIYFRASPTTGGFTPTLENFSISGGCYVALGSTAPVIFLDGATTNSIRRGAINGTLLRLGAEAIKGVNAGVIAISGNCGVGHGVSPQIDVDGSYTLSGNQGISDS